MNKILGIILYICMLVPTGLAISGERCKKACDSGACPVAACAGRTDCTSCSSCPDKASKPDVANKTGDADEASEVVAVAETDHGGTADLKGVRE